MMNRVLWNDAAEPWDFGFQDSGSITMEGIVQLHDEIMVYLTALLVLVSWLLTSIFIKDSHNKIRYKYMSHGTLLELIWTISPAFILIAIAFPSLRLLYLTDEVIDPAITIKIIGHQWYWSAEYSDYDNAISFDSYMIPTDELENGQLRLLEVDNRIIIPVDTHIRFLVTGADVIHSFGIPSLGIKVDALPGRLNQTSTIALREGVFYGQCYELCGIWHDNMPITVEAVSLEKYLLWLKQQMTE